MKGRKLVYIGPKRHYHDFKWGKVYLETISRLSPDSEYVYINNSGPFLKDDFITLEEWRDKNIKKILE